MSFDNKMIIDATRGTIARFVNHSCEPNCEMIKWTVGGEPRMALFAGRRGIMTGEELTYDYNFEYVYKTSAGPTLTFTALFPPRTFRSATAEHDRVEVSWVRSRRNRRLLTNRSCPRLHRSLLEPSAS
jgi:SET domain-containing protein